MEATHTPQHLEQEPQWHQRGESPDYLFSQLGKGRCVITSLNDGTIVIDTPNWGLACGVFARICVEAATARFRNATTSWVVDLPYPASPAFDGSNPFDFPEAVGA